MITRKQSIERFSLKMDELISSNYLLTDKKITAVLKAVTSSKLFYELICFTAEGFDYTSYLNSLPRGEAFPVSNKRLLIAFGFSLLSELDCKNEDILSVLSIYYGAESFDKSYKLFAEGFLTPFKNAVLYVTGEMLAQSSVNEKEDAKVVVSIGGVGQQLELKQVKQPETNSETKKYLTCYRDIQKLLISEKAKIIHCKHVKDAEKSDLLVLLDRFKDALFRGNKQEIKATFISYKYAILGFKRIETEIDEVERILKFCKAIVL